ncbi:MAG: hypothetical protein ACYC9N_15035, partial [Thermoanaerobaculia bacterium]
MTRTTSASGAVIDHHLLLNAVRPRVIDRVGASCASCGGETTLAYNFRGTLIREQDNRGYITSYAYDADERLVRVLQNTLRPANCDPATATDHCRLTPEALITADLAYTEATTTTRYEYNDPAWPTRATDVYSASIAQPAQETHDALLLDPETGRVLRTTRIGWTGDPVREESRTSSTILYDGLEAAAFDPGSFFDRAWLTLPQPKSAVKRVDGSRTDVIDVADSVYYPEDASVPMVLRGHLAARRNAAGQITQWLAYDVWGNATRVADANGVTTEFTFDGLGRPVDSTIKGVTGCNTTDDPLCATDLTTTNVYASPTGPLSEQHAAGGGVTAYQYDDRGRISSVSPGTSATDLRERIEYQYDPGTAKKTVERVLTNESGSWIEKKRDTFGYDTEGRLTTITHADGTSIAYDYLACGLMSAQRDENHTTWNTLYEYDAGGRLATVRQALATAPGGWIETRYLYDFAGNLIAVTDPNGNTTTYQYDDFGQMLRQTSPVTGVTAYAYDPAGNLLATTDANNATTARTYDALGRALTATSSKAGAPTESVTWIYDDTTGGAFGIGRLASMSDPTGGTTYLYSRRGLLRRETKTIRGATYVTGFGYDADGNRSRVGRTTRRPVDYTFDYAGRPVTAATGATPLVTSTAYLPFGPATAIAFGNGTTKRMTFDARYRPVVNRLDGPAGAIASYLYGHDAADNITSIDDITDPGYNRDFGYDDVNRLVTANGGANLWGTGSYSYDAMGNMLTATLGTWRTASFALTGTTPKIASATENGARRAVGYDAAGNESHAGADSFTYSPRNHLRAGGNLSYAYDGRGVRTITTRQQVIDLVSVAIVPSSVTGGTAAEGVVLLSTPAPFGGLVVLLGSSTTELVVPAQVIIEAGAVSATFAIATRPVVADVIAVVTGTLGDTTREATLTVLAPVLANLSFDVSSLYGGSSATGTVTFTGRTVGGKTLTLSSSSAALSVPASVAVAAGESAANFAAAATPVETESEGVVTVTDGAQSQTAGIRILPPELAGFAVTPATVVGGEPATAEAQINAPAAVGGAPVAIASSDQALVPPANLVVAEGTTEGAASLPTAPVASDTPVLVSATRNGITLSSVLTLAPPPVTIETLTITPPSLVGSNNAVGTITLNDPAPLFGIEAELVSSDPSVTVPAVVQFAPGQTQATFPIGTAVVPVSTPVTITATHAVTTKLATITLLPPAGNYVTSVSAVPAFIAGGFSSTGTVTLAMPSSDNGGSDVTLTSDDPAVILPSRVTVKRNQTSATFAITTNL